MKRCRPDTPKQPGENTNITLTSTLIYSTPLFESTCVTVFTGVDAPRAAARTPEAVAVARAAAPSAAVPAGHDAPSGRRCWIRHGHASLSTGCPATRPASCTASRDSGALALHQAPWWGSARSTFQLPAGSHPARPPTAQPTGPPSHPASLSSLLRTLHCWPYHYLNHHQPLLGIPAAGRHPPQRVLGIESTLVPSVQAALTAPSSSLATPPLPQLAPFSGSIPPSLPSLPQQQQEVSSLTLMICCMLWRYGWEEPPISLQVGDGQHLEVPRKPRKRPITTFTEWVRCYSVYCHHLLAHQPMRSADLMGYLYIIATCQAEYNFASCLAYDIAFSKKAAQLKLTSWGQFDPQFYTKAFTGAGKVKLRAWCDHCLAPSHTSANCPHFYAAGPAKQSRVAMAGPKQPQKTPPQSTCRNYNSGACSRSNCPRPHMCLTPGCLRKHPVTLCPKRGASPWKP